MKEARGRQRASYALAWFVVLGLVALVVGMVGLLLWTSSQHPGIPTQ